MPIVGSGTPVLIPRSTASGVQFVVTEFNERLYLEANPELITAGVEPTAHFCIYGFKEGRLLRPSQSIPGASQVAGKPQENVALRPLAKNPAPERPKIQGSALRLPAEPLSEARATGTKGARTGRYKFSIVACARWEAEYITEWVSYHRSIGFDHIYLYCNDDDPTQLYERLSLTLAEPDPFVTFTYYPFLGLQRQMYRPFFEDLLQRDRVVHFP